MLSSIIALIVGKTVVDVAGHGTTVLVTSSLGTVDIMLAWWDLNPS